MNLWLRRKRKRFQMSRLEIGASAIRKANGYGEKGYVIQFTYSDGTGMNPLDFAYKKSIRRICKEHQFSSGRNNYVFSTVRLDIRRGAGFINEYGSRS